MSNLTRLEEDALIARAHEIIVRRAETAEAALRKVKAENSALRETLKEVQEEVVHADRHANYVIGIHQRHGEQAMKRRTWLPYKDG